MSEAEANPETGARTGFGGLPTWLRIGIVAASTIVVVLVFSVIIRVILQTPNIPTGTTAVTDLQPGSCLLEAGDADEYTVVGCTTPHKQQVIASVDLAFPGVSYSADESLAIFAEETCKRLLEYRLYLDGDIVKTDYLMIAIAPPTLERYEAGDTETLCAVYDADSEDITSDLYRPMPT